MRATLFGEFEVQIDANGRINVPRKLHDLFAHGGFLTRAFNGISLIFFTHEAWLQVEDRLDKLEFTELDGEDVRRFFGCGSEVKLDNQGRLSVSSRLRDRARLEKDITMIAMGDRIEIWNTALWNEYDRERFTQSRLREMASAISTRKPAEASAE
jgi:MraZ protein